MDMTADRLQLKKEIEEACRQAHWQWTGCHWSTQIGQCRIDVKDVSAEQALGLAERYEAIAQGATGTDPERRQLQRAIRLLQDSGAPEPTMQQAAAQLALDYREASTWLQTVEDDAGKAEALALEVVGKVWLAWYFRDDDPFLKARHMTQGPAEIEATYQADRPTWGHFCALLEEYLKVPPQRGR